MNPKQKNSQGSKISTRLGSKARSNTALLDSSGQVQTSSLSSSGQAKRDLSGRQQKRLRQRYNEGNQFSNEKPVVLLSKSMEKTFLRLSNPEARKAFVDAELVNGLAHQIRVLRKQREWTQQDLACRLNTTQAAVSRLEDPSYGRFSVKSLLALGEAFDVALHVRFLPFSKFLVETWDTREERFHAESYEEECGVVQFFSEAKSSSYVNSLSHESPSSCYRVITVQAAVTADREVESLEIQNTLPTIHYFVNRTMTPFLSKK